MGGAGDLTKVNNAISTFSGSIFVDSIFYAIGNHPTFTNSLIFGYLKFPPSIKFVESSPYSSTIVVLDSYASSFDVRYLGFRD